MPSKITQPLSLYLEGSASINSKFQDLAKTIDGLEKKLMKWAVPEEQGGGGLFYKQAAVNLAAYIKEKALTGEAFTGLEGLSQVTHQLKAGERNRYPTALNPEIGFATGQMVEAIRAVKAGKGWKVGISQNQRVVDKIGSFDYIYDYFKVFELGHPKKEGVPGEKRGVAEQPPRPWFGLAFLRWTREKAPALVKHPFVNEISKRLLNVIDNVEQASTDYGDEEQAFAEGSNLNITGGTAQGQRYESSGKSYSKKYVSQFDFLTKVGTVIKLYTTPDMSKIRQSLEEPWMSYANAVKKYNLKKW